MARKKSTDWPLWTPKEADGECKYLVLASGEILLIDPCSYASHADAAQARGVRRDEVRSAGRVVIDRQARTVTMAERDSWTLRVRSAPGDQDAESIRALVFGSAKRKRR